MSPVISALVERLNEFSKASIGNCPVAQFATDDISGREGGQCAIGSVCTHSIATVKTYKTFFLFPDLFEGM